jgi:hypothetical protein
VLVFFAAALALAVVWTAPELGELVGGVFDLRALAQRVAS